MVLLVLAAVTGCAQNATSKASSSAPKPAPKETGHSMAGPDVQINIPVTIIRDKPKPWNLSTPQSAVRSYLDWTSYAYRITTSDVATPTMSAHEAVIVDSYTQYNLEKKKLLDQQLTSITFGAPSKTASGTTIPTKEMWTYSYRSLAKGNAVLGGPYAVGYDVVYTVVRQKNGQWVVDSVKATKTSGTLK